MKPRVAFIGTGGTIASQGAGPLDTTDYGSSGKPLLDAPALVARYPELAEVADVLPVPFSAVPSPQIHFPTWKALAELCDRLVAEHPDLAGIVIGHGTATLEETAYALHLAARVSVPVVVTGAQRPPTALASDAGMNLVNAVRVAAHPGARGLGVLVVLNDEIHAAREVTKTSTGRLQTFRSPDVGVLGHADGDSVNFFRRPVRPGAPRTPFDLRALEALPRVDIAYAYAGADGTAVRAFLAAGARGIVSAGFAPGFCAPDEFEPLREAAAAGVIVMQCTRAGSGRVFPSARLSDAGFLTTDNLNPQKARILLAFCLTVTEDPEEVARLFATF